MRNKKAKVKAKAQVKVKVKVKAANSVCHNLAKGYGRFENKENSGFIESQEAVLLK